MSWKSAGGGREERLRLGEVKRGGEDQVYDPCPLALTEKVRGDVRGEGDGEKVGTLDMGMSMGMGMGTSGLFNIKPHPIMATLDFRKACLQTKV